MGGKEGKNRMGCTLKWSGRGSGVFLDWLARFVPRIGNCGLCGFWYEHALLGALGAGSCFFFVSS